MGWVGGWVGEWVGGWVSGWVGKVLPKGDVKQRAMSQGSGFWRHTGVVFSGVVEDLTTLFHIFVVTREGVFEKIFNEMSDPLLSPTSSHGPNITRYMTWQRSPPYPPPHPTGPTLVCTWREQRSPPYLPPLSTGLTLVGTWRDKDPHPIPHLIPRAQH